VNEVLDAGDAEAAEHLLDNSVVCDGSASAVKLDVAALVDQSLDRGNRRETVGDVGLDSA